MPGPPRQLTSAEKKRRRIVYYRQRRTKTVHIGDVIADWKKLKAESGVNTDEAMAKLLIERLVL